MAISRNFQLVFHFEKSFDSGDISRQISEVRKRQKIHKVMESNVFVKYILLMEMV